MVSIEPPTLPIGTKDAELQWYWYSNYAAGSVVDYENNFQPRIDEKQINLFVCSYTIVDYKLEQYFSLTPNQPAVNNSRSFTACRTGC